MLAHTYYSDIYKTIRNHTGLYAVRQLYFNVYVTIKIIGRILLLFWWKRPSFTAV